MANAMSTSSSATASAATNSGGKYARTVASNVVSVRSVMMRISLTLQV